MQIAQVAQKLSVALTRVRWVFIFSPVWKCKKCNGTERYVSGGCKPCRASRSRANYEKNREKAKAYARQYHLDPANREKRKAYCRDHYRKNREARLLQSKEYATRNPEQLRDYSKRHKYGISAETYDALIRMQEGKCRICDRSDMQLHLDHCHSTGKLRGFLCPPCNHGIGRFQDNPELLRKAADYVEFFKNSAWVSPSCTYT